MSTARTSTINNTSFQQSRPELRPHRCQLDHLIVGIMAQSDTPNLDSLSLSDTDLNDTEDLFASPSVPSRKPKAVQHPESSRKNPSHNAPPPPPETSEDALAAHEQSLKRELSSLRTMNQVVSGVVESLEKAKSNMEVVSATVTNASELLTTWTRNLSQTEHNQRLILNSKWQGASQDIADGENEEVLKRQEKERRDAEEVRRAEAREGEKEEEERRRMTEAAPSKGQRGRARGTGRGMSRPGAGGYVGVGGQGGVRGTTSKGIPTPGRGSALGRGAARGRGRQ